jgi:hypothetical protein
MFIAKAHRGRRAPLGAACPVHAMVWDGMPLLPELENHLVGPFDYKHGAPKGASHSPSHL